MSVSLVVCAYRNAGMKSKVRNNIFTFMFEYL